MRSTLFVSAVLALPLFFGTLMCVTLAIDKPHRIEWQRGGRLIQVDHGTTDDVAARLMTDEENRP